MMRRVRSGFFGSLLFGVVALGGCETVPESLHPPQLLRDSLDLGDDDPVYEIGLAVTEGAETATPDTVELAWRAHLSFRSDDPRARRVLPDTVGLDPALAAFLGDRLLGSPPLVHRESRWVLDLREAPPGILPFRVIGSAREGRVIVRIPETGPGR